MGNGNCAYTISSSQENQLKKLTELNLTAAHDDTTRSMATKQVLMQLCI